MIDGVAELGFPLSIHLEAAYGTNKAAFDTRRTPRLLVALNAETYEWAKKFERRTHQLATTETVRVSDRRNRRVRRSALRDRLDGLTFVTVGLGAS